ncbi:acyloxyacyl hydrolase [Pelagibacterium nitratireducens]|uniref:Acyloxyacyl hydrolase n=1 Tax=Pelagibacterium nitratireducens TaxID=1046114 RepID=A0ABZ2I7L1_9HYPH
MRKSVIVALGAMMVASPVAAQDIALDELRAGVFFHSAYGGFLPTGNNWDLSRLEDVKFSALFTSPDIEAFRWIGSPRPEIGATLNFNGRENILHANLNWQIPVFETPLYLELGFGAAVTDGALSGATLPARNFGCSFNFYDAAGIGANVSENVTVTLRYEHISNLELCAPNEGLSNLGVMVGVKF